MRLPRPFALSLLAVAASGCAVAATGAARVTILDDDPAVISRAIADRPDGSSGLRLDDNIHQFLTKPAVLPSYRQVVRISGGAGTAGRPGLAGRDAAQMAAILRDGVRTAGSHRVVVDDVGASYGDGRGQMLADALEMLRGDRAKYARDGFNRRVDLFIASPAALLADPAWSGARRAASLSGGVWLKTYGDGTAGWDPAQWLAWPAEAQAQLTASGSEADRVHVIFGADRPQAVLWRLAKTGSACRVLGNGPGGYRLGSAIDDFVAQYRRALPITTSSKVPVTGCVLAPSLGAAAARALEGATALEESGLEIPPGGLVTPPLPAGEPAQVTLQLDADPLGLAAALGVSPEAFWTAARVQLEVRGPGVSVDVPVEGDGVARIAFTAAAPGPVTMRLVLGQEALTRVLGAPPDLVASLRAAGVGATFIRRVVADPSGWSIAIPLQQAGGAPGSPVLQIVPPAA